MTIAFAAATPITLRITRAGGPKDRGELVIRNAGKVAEFLFTFDPSSSARDSYDNWIAHDTDPERLAERDVEIINRTMGARSPHKAWAAFLGRDLPWLSALDPGWELFDLAPAEWPTVRGRLRDALQALIGPYRKLSIVTKVLHMKRPRLVPVCDSYVRAEMLALRPEAPSADAAVSVGLDLITHLRDEGRRNLAELQAVRDYLLTRRLDRTRVRILDLLLWSSYPSAPWSRIEPLLAEWFGG
jgi:hypothetical protein